MCPSYLATRDEKDSTRGRARVLQELANGTLVKDFALGGGGRVAGPVPVVQGLLVGLPGRGGHGDLQGRGAVPAVPAWPRPPAHYSLGWLPRWARLASYAPGLANAVLRNPALRGLAKRLGGIDARRPLPQFAAESFRAWFAAVPPGPGLRCCCGWTRSPTTSPPGSARPPCGCSRRSATRW